MLHKNRRMWIQKTGRDECNISAIFRGIDWKIATNRSLSRISNTYYNTTYYLNKQNNCRLKLNNKALQDYHLFYIPTVSDEK